MKPIALFCIIIGFNLVFAEYNCHKEQTTYANIASTNCTYTQNSEDVYTSLTYFYDALNGDHWYDTTNWLNDTVSYCEWAGLECDFQCNIISIQLINNNLIGIIPEEISALKFLQNFDLFCNHVQHGLDSIKNLKFLRNINLTYNNVAGTIPIEFGQMSYLQNLNMQQNRIEGTIPESLGYLSNLTYFNIVRNRIEGVIPHSFSNLNLTIFLVSENHHLSGSLDILNNM